MSYSSKASNQGSKVIYINSRDADVYLEQNEFGEDLHTNFLFNLTEKLVVNPNQSALISLYSATIPHSFYNVRAGVNDKIVFDIEWETHDPSPVVYSDTYTIQLDDGNYNTDELIRRIIYGNDPETADEGRFPESEYIGFKDLKFTDGTAGGVPLNTHFIHNSAELSIRYERVANVVRFQLDAKNNTLVNYVKVKFNWATAPTIGYNTTGSTTELANALLGFSGKVDYPNNDTQVSPEGDWAVAFARTPSTSSYPERAVLQSQQVIDLNDNIHGLMLKSNLVSSGTMNSKASVFSNILARIPITSLDNATTESGTGRQGGMIYYNPSTSTHQNLVYLRAVDIMGIRLTDDNERTIDLNGLDFQVAILIQFIDSGTQIEYSPSRMTIDNRLAQAQQLLTPQQDNIKIKKSNKKGKK